MYYYFVVTGAEQTMFHLIRFKQSKEVITQWPMKSRHTLRLCESIHKQCGPGHVATRLNITLFPKIFTIDASHPPPTRIYTHTWDPFYQNGSA